MLARMKLFSHGRPVQQRPSISVGFSWRLPDPDAILGSRMNCLGRGFFRMTSGGGVLLDDSAFQFDLRFVRAALSNLEMWLLGKLPNTRLEKPPNSPWWSGWDHGRSSLPPVQIERAGERARLQGYLSRRKTCGSAGVGGTGVGPPREEAHPW